MARDAAVPRGAAPAAASAPDLGNYAAFDALVRRNMALLVGAGLTLRFFFDGPAY